MYLRKRDYDRLIQADNLTQIISSDDNIRLLAELAAKEEVESYLKSKYDTSSELTDLVPFDIAENYYPGQRVMLTGYPTYNPTGTYNAVDKTIVLVGSGSTATAWIITSDLNNAGPWDASFGVKLGQVDDIFTLSFVSTPFSYLKKVSKGDTRYWKGLLYKAIRDWLPITHYDQLQAQRQPNDLYPNLFPDEDTSNKQWIGGVSSATAGFYPNEDVSAYDNATTYTQGERAKQNDVIYISNISGNLDNTPGTDITKWIPVMWLKGDSRSQQLVSAMLDISLYHIHSRIAPRNIPDLRVKRYDDARAWLQSANKGDITPNLPLLQPNKPRIRWGSVTKLNNTY